MLGTSMPLLITIPTRIATITEYYSCKVSFKANSRLDHQMSLALAYLRAVTISKVAQESSNQQMVEVDEEHYTQLCS